jgi:hypothetical protein
LGHIGHRKVESNKKQWLLVIHIPCIRRKPFVYEKYTFQNYKIMSNVALKKMKKLLRKDVTGVTNPGRLLVNGS